MTEAEWLVCADPRKMFAHVKPILLRKYGKGASRKLRLFACAAVRSIWDKLTDERSRNAVSVSERFADGEATARELVSAREAALEARIADPEETQPVRRAAHRAAGWDSIGAAEDTAAELRRIAGAEARQLQCALLRDVFDNLFFAMTIPAHVLAWSDRTIPRIAQGIYEKRRFGDLPILADALLDAGCDDETILSHCRSDGPHVRGCWVIDLILGKE
jgi:hypothetical protein